MSTPPVTFAHLAASRREWIDSILRPWCTTAARRELLQAEHEWTDVAGKVDPNKTLWFWAWSRFPELVNHELTGIDETGEVTVTLADGREVRGYPDARESLHGELVLLCPAISGRGRGEFAGPFSLDDVTQVRRGQG